MLKQVLVEL
jgi:hypothetical protein